MVGPHRPKRAGRRAVAEAVVVMVGTLLRARAEQLGAAAWCVPAFRVGLRRPCEAIAEDKLAARLQ